MSKPNLRAQMPVIAAIIDDLREIFGRPVIDELIRRGKQGEPVFWATEDGIEFGTRSRSATVFIVGGRGIFYHVQVPNGQQPDAWMKKAYAAMDRIEARMKAACQQQAQISPV